VTASQNFRWQRKQTVYGSGSSPNPELAGEAGITVGILEGSYEAVRDLFKGSADLVRLGIDLEQQAITQLRPVAEIAAKKLMAYLQSFPSSDKLAAALGSYVAKRWGNADMFGRTRFVGEVMGYLAMNVLLVVATGGESVEAELAESGSEISRVALAVAKNADEGGDLVASVRASASQFKGPAEELARARNEENVATRAAAQHATSPTANTSTSQAGAAKTAHAVKEGGGAAKPDVVEVYSGPDLQSARHISGQNPGARVVAAEARLPPSATEIAKFRAEGGEFLQERFAESLPPNSVKKIYVRYPIPHEKGLENASADFMREVEKELAEHPEMSRVDAMLKVQASMDSRNVESMTNLGPHALEMLEPNATMEVMFWEKEIGPEIKALTKHIYMDPQTGERFTLEIASGPIAVPRAKAPHSGFGIGPEVQTVSEMVLRKVPAR